MKKSLVISEQDSIAALLENERVVEFFVNRGELLLGDIYSATVENILPGIDAAFVNLGKDKMGFLHANDVPGQGPLKERLVPKQKLLVQITKEPTGHKGPRVSTAISLPGRFLVLVPEERGVSISRRISEARERSRLKSVVNLMKPPGVGLIIRTEAKGQGENELFEDFEALWDRWQTVVSEGEASIGSSLIYRDQDLLYRVIRDAYSHDVVDIICDSADGQRRAQEYLHGWAGKLTKVSHHQGDESLLVSKGVDKEIEAALSDRVELPSGGHLNIQPTEALTVIDVNSGRFTSSRTQAETVRRTNVEAAQEIPRQLRLRNIGGMVIVDFIDMDSRKDQQQVLEVFQRVLEEDRAKPQVGQLSDLGLVELTRRRQGQSLRELFTVHCNTCSGLGVVPTLELGPADNRRVITFKSKEEEQAGRRGSRGGGRAQAGRGSVLRAASAANGRVVPTVEEPVEPEFDESAYVPEDILEQMPDELLMDDPRAMGKPSTKRGAFLDTQEDDEDELEAAEGEEVPFSTESFAPAAGIFEEGFVEDEESASPMHEGLEESISAVEEVYQDMGARSRVQEDEVEVVVITPQTATVEEPPAPTLQEEVEEELDEQEDLVSFASTSPYETEIDPVTGIYRLKIKPAGQEGGEQSQGEHGHESHEHAHHDHANHDHEHSHEHHTHADHVVAGEAVEEQPDAVAAEEFVQSEVNAEGHVVQGNLFNDSYQGHTHGSDNSQTAEEESRSGAENENVETRADEYETKTAEWQEGTQQAQSEEAEENDHEHRYKQEESTPPQPQETHNS
jgi:Rne/Rng family ribonuclease